MAYFQFWLQTANEVRAGVYGPPYFCAVRVSKSNHASEGLPFDEAKRGAVLALLNAASWVEPDTDESRTMFRLMSAIEPLEESTLVFGDNPLQGS